MSEVKLADEEYNIRFTLDDIRQLVLDEQIYAHDIIPSLKKYKILHEPFIKIFEMLYKKTPRMPEKFAYIILLSYSRQTILNARCIDDFKLFGDHNLCSGISDFKVIETFDSTFNEFDIEHNDRHDCICGYCDLKYVTVVENKETGLRLNIGSECICKSKLVSKSDIDRVKSITKQLKENKAEQTSGLPIGYYKQQRQEKKQYKLEQKNKKWEEKLKTGDYANCVMCSDEVCIKKKKTKKKKTPICNKCTKNGVKYTTCLNCENGFTHSLSTTPDLCDKCVHQYKVVNCKGGDHKVVLSINSTDKYCDDCDIKIKKCIDCSNDFIQQQHETRCPRHEYAYKNNMIYKHCVSCQEEICLTQHDHWKTYCNDCYKSSVIKKQCTDCYTEFSTTEHWKTRCKTCNHNRKKN